MVQDLNRSITQLQHAASELKLRLPNLISDQGAAQITRLKLAEAADSAKAQLEESGCSEIFCGGNPPIDIIAQGSMGRGEMSQSESDFDYILVAYQIVEDPRQIVAIRDAAEHAERAVNPDKLHGSTTGFGGMASAIDLVDTIGLNADTNVDSTRRNLLLWESVPLLGPERFEALLKTLLQRYLDDYRPGPNGEDRSKSGVPRFLLNDIVRFWRTLAVDYQAKRWLSPSADKGGMRYLKLRSTRKLNFIGALVPLMLPAIEGVKVSVDGLLDGYGLTALARISLLEQHLEGESSRAALGKILHLADEFSHFFSDPDFRVKVSRVSDPRDPKADPVFKHVQGLTVELQEALEALFLSDEPIGNHQAEGTTLTLGQLTSRYLLF
jgi:hypothetical protein